MNDKPYLIDFKRINKTRKSVIEELRNKGIGTQVHYIPVYLQPYYKKVFGYGPGLCQNAENYYEKCLSLPLYPGMSEQDTEAVISAVKTLY